MAFLGQPKKYFCFPLLDPVPGVWVGRSETYYFYFSNFIPVELSVNSPNIGKKTKITNNAD